MKKIFMGFGCACLASLLGTQSLMGQTIIASENFDGGATNLTSSNVPTIDGGGGDTFAVGATAAWPTTGGTPFSIADNSVGDVGDTTAFAGDTEGIFGQNSNFDNMFLGVSDNDEDAFVGAVATFVFDISSAGTDPLTFSIDMGSMEGGGFGYGDDTSFLFTASIDGSAAQTLFSITPDAAGAGFAYRALDDDNVISAINTLGVTGDNAVTKLLADTGLAAANNFLDKSLASDGTLDTFQTAINGTGSELTLTFTANVPFEAAAFDNFVITSEGVAIPEPSSLGLLGLVAITGLGRRRRS